MMSVRAALFAACLCDERICGALAADYVDTTDLTLTQKLADRGILTAYKVPGFEGLEPALRDGNGKWYTLWRSMMAIGVNTAQVKPADLPAQWTDLLDPKWKGKIRLSRS